MPSVPLESFHVGPVTGHIEYNNANNRISRFYWNDVPVGFELQITIWDTLSAQFPNPIFDGTFVASGETPIAGNYVAVEEADPYDGELARRIPPNIKIIMQMRSA